MMLAALLDAGLPLAELNAVFADGGLSLAIQARPEHRQSIGGMTVSVERDNGQPLRHLPEIFSLIEQLPLSASVAAASQKAFERLASVEAAVHGVSVDAVHFHEVGAIDTIVDVVGTFWALERLGVEQVTATSLPWFSGTVSCEHGVLPLPAPAVLELYKGKKVHSTDFTQEMVTPTGALLIDQLVDSVASKVGGTLTATGLGYGMRETGGGLRICLFDVEADDGFETNVDSVYVLESHIDHLTGEELGRCFDLFMDAGALDVFFTAGIMKKNRPAGSLKVLCGLDDLERMQQLFFTHTHTLGIRRQKVERVLLSRKNAQAETPYGTMDAKTYELDGMTISKPEYEELVKFSKKTGRSLPELRYMLFGDTKT